MSPIFILLLIVATAIAVPSDPRPKKRCPKDEIWKECGSRCEPTCKSIQNPDPIVCIALCVEGCFCKEGYLKNGEKNDKCVKRSECKKA